MSYNATLHPTSAADLYAGTDFSKLNWAENLWAQWYLWIGNPVIATGLMSFLLHEVRFHAAYACSLYLQTFLRGCVCR